MLATVQYGLYAPSGGEIDHLHGHSRLYIAVYTALSRKWWSYHAGSGGYYHSVATAGHYLYGRNPLPSRTGGT
jgi:hypothetical protein